MRTIRIVKLVVVNDADEVLLLERGMDAPFRPGDHDYPGGHVDGNEGFAEAVCRELAEETDLHITVTQVDLFYGHTEVVSNDISVVRLIFWTRVTGRPHITLSPEHESHRWVPMAQVPVLFAHPVFGGSVAYALENRIFTGKIPQKTDAKAVVFREDGQVLLMKRALDDTDRPGDQDFPGGGVDEHENFTSAVVREIAEEAGLHVSPADVHLFYAATEMKPRGSTTRLIFWTRVRQPDVRLSFEHTDYRWVPVENVPTEFPHRVYSVSVEYALANRLFE